MGNLHSSVQSFAENFTKTKPVGIGYFFNLMTCLGVANSCLSVLFMLRYCRLRMARRSEKIWRLSQRKLSNLPLKTYSKQLRCSSIRWDCHSLTKIGEAVTKLGGKLQK